MRIRAPQRFVLVSDLLVVFLLPDTRCLCNSIFFPFFLIFKATGCSVSQPLDTGAQRSNKTHIAIAQ